MEISFIPYIVYNYRNNSKSNYFIKFLKYFEEIDPKKSNIKILDEYENCLIPIQIDKKYDKKMRIYTTNTNYYVVKIKNKFYLYKIYEIYIKSISKEKIDDVLLTIKNGENIFKTITDDNYYFINVYETKYDYEYIKKIPKIYKLYLNIFIDKQDADVLKLRNDLSKYDFERYNYDIWEMILELNKKDNKKLDKKNTIKNILHDINNYFDYIYKILETVADKDFIDLIKYFKLNKYDDHKFVLELHLLYETNEQIKIFERVIKGLTSFYLIKHAI